MDRHYSFWGIASAIAYLCKDLARVLRGAIPAYVIQHFVGIGIGLCMSPLGWPVLYELAFPNDTVRLLFTGILQVGVYFYLFELASEGEPPSLKELSGRPLHLGISSLAVGFSYYLPARWLLFQVYPPAQSWSWGVTFLFITAPMMASPIMLSQIFTNKGRRGAFFRGMLLAAFINEMLTLLIQGAFLDEAPTLGLFPDWDQRWTLLIALLKSMFVLLVVLGSLWKVPGFIERWIATEENEISALGKTFVLGAIFAGLTRIAGVKTAFGFAAAAFFMSRLRAAAVTGRSSAAAKEIANTWFMPVFYTAIGIVTGAVAKFSLELFFFMLTVPVSANVFAGLVAVRFSGIPRGERLSAVLCLSVQSVVALVLFYLLVVDGLMAPEVLLSASPAIVIVTWVLETLIARSTLPKLADSFADLAERWSESVLANLGACSREKAVTKLCSALVAADAVQFAEGETKTVAELSDEIWRGVRESERGEGRTIVFTEYGITRVVHPCSVRGPSLALGYVEDGMSFSNSDGVPSHVLLLVLAPDSTSEEALGHYSHYFSVHIAQSEKNSAFQTRMLSRSRRGHAISFDDVNETLQRSAA